MTLAEHLSAELRQPTVIKTGRNRETVTRLTAIIRKLVSMALSGDPKAIKLFQSQLQLYRSKNPRIFDPPEPPQYAKFTWTPEDEVMWQRLLELKSLSDEQERDEAE
jgi:hypothetical protein